MGQLSRFDNQVIELGNRLGVESSEIYRRVDTELQRKRIAYHPDTPYWKLLRALVTVGWRFAAEVNGAYDRMTQGGN
jgi:hypothetical protein